MAVFRLAATAVVLLTVASPAFADCVPSYNFTLAEDETVTTTMSPRVGERCRLGLGRVGMAVGGVDVTRSPSHGKLAASVSGVTYIAGRSAGTDRFAFRWVGRNRFGRPSFMGVDVTVTILP